jgi:hypothetical protein
LPSPESRLLVTKIKKMGEEREREGGEREQIEKNFEREGGRREIKLSQTAQKFHA